MNQPAAAAPATGVPAVPSTVTMAHSYTVLAPVTEQTYMVTCTEWDFLRNRVNRIGNAPWLLQTVGAVLLGAGFAELVTILAGAIPAEPPKFMAYAFAFMCAAFITGAALMFVARRVDTRTTTSASDVVEHMRLIEGRFPPR
jgi:hypothetical protein